VEPRKALKDRYRTRQPGGGRAIILVEQRHHLLQRVKNSLGMLQPGAVGAKLLLLADTEPGGVDLGELESMEILLSSAICQLFPERREGPALGFPVSDQALHALTTRHALGEAVEQVELACRLNELAVLVLPVQLDEQVAQAFHEPHGRGPVVDEDSVAAR